MTTRMWPLLWRPSELDMTRVDSSTARISGFFTLMKPFNFWMYCHKQSSDRQRNPDFCLYALLTFLIRASRGDETKNHFQDQVLCRSKVQCTVNILIPIWSFFSIQNLCQILLHMSGSRVLSFPLFEVCVNTKYLTIYLFNHPLI